MFLVFTINYNNNNNNNKNNNYTNSNDQQTRTKTIANNKATHETKITRKTYERHINAIDKE